MLGEDDFVPVDAGNAPPVEVIESVVDKRVVLGSLPLGVLDQKRARDLQEAVLALTEHDGGDLRPKPGGIVLGVQERLEALNALGRVEELLMGLDDLVDALAR